MRIFLFSIAGIPLLLLDGILLYDLPSQIVRFSSREERWLLLGGAVLYLMTHAFMRKPERLYLWAHEFSHLIVAKLFFRKVHSFHITSRDGGKVVIDRTNVVIDLAPYILPLYSLAAVCVGIFFRSVSPWAPDIYLAVVSFLFTMHLFFSAEGFVKGQPDLSRSGRLFSGGLILLCLMLWVPCLLAPGTVTGWKGSAAAYRGWFEAGRLTGRRLFLYVMSLF